MKPSTAITSATSIRALLHRQPALSNLFSNKSLTQTDSPAPRANLRNYSLTRNIFGRVRVALSGISAKSQRAALRLNATAALASQQDVPAEVSTKANQIAREKLAKLYTQLDHSFAAKDREMRIAMVRALSPQAVLALHTAKPTGLALYSVFEDLAPETYFELFALSSTNTALRERLLGFTSGRAFIERFNQASTEQRQQMLQFMEPSVVSNYCKNWHECISYKLSKAKANEQLQQIGAALSSQALYAICFEGKANLELVAKMIPGVGEDAFLEAFANPIRDAGKRINRDKPSPKIEILKQLVEALSPEAFLKVWLREQSYELRGLLIKLVSGEKFDQACVISRTAEYKDRYGLRDFHKGMRL